MALQHSTVAREFATTERLMDGAQLSSLDEPWSYELERVDLERRAWGFWGGSEQAGA